MILSLMSYYQNLSTDFHLQHNALECQGQRHLEIQLKLTYRQPILLLMERQLLTDYCCMELKT